MTHGYCISSFVLRILLKHTEDMPHGTGYPHGTEGDLQVLSVKLTATQDMTDSYCIL